MTLVRIVMMGLLLCVMGCGDDEEDGDGGGGGGETAFGCDMEALNMCMDNVYTNLPADQFDRAKDDCVNKNDGTVVESCDTTDAVGGCRQTVANGGITIEYTTWNYALDAATVEEACTEAGGEFVEP
jgi:hypothetical protein